MTTSILGGGGGFHRFFCKSARSAHRKCEKRVECSHDAGSPIYSNTLGVRLPVCPVIKNEVLMLIKFE